MATEQQVQKVLSRLAEVRHCTDCHTSIRFGDMDCPHCGADIEDDLRIWAESLIDDLVH